MTKKQKIFNLVVLFTIVSLLAYLSIVLKSDEMKIELISLDGNYHLTKEQYFEFSGLMNKSEFQNLSLQIIKDRIEKHPYIAEADVRYEGNGKVFVKITEKVFESILFRDEKQFLITENLQVLPFLPKTKKIDYPIISNLKAEKIIPLIYANQNQELVVASKIINGIKLLNPELSEGLSTIDLSNGKDIILFFSLIDYPVILGRGDEIRKSVCFNNLWTYLKGKEINNIMKYVDLRFTGHIYLGLQESSEEGEKS